MGEGFLKCLLNNVSKFLIIIPCIDGELFVKKVVDLDILQDKFCTDERGAEMKIGDGVDFVAKFWIMYK
jgi:hypothetical protein